MLAWTMTRSIRRALQQAALHAAVARQHGLPRRYALRSDDTGSWLVVLVLVYVMREPDEVRAISLRRASKQERKLYAKNNQ